MLAPLRSLSVSVSLYLCVSVFVSFCVCFCLSLCLSLYLSLSVSPQIFLHLPSVPCYTTHLCDILNHLPPSTLPSVAGLLPPGRHSGPHPTPLGSPSQLIPWKPRVWVPCPQARTLATRTLPSVLAAHDAKPPEHVAQTHGVEPRTTVLNLVQGHRPLSRTCQMWFPSWGPVTLTL